MRWTTDREDRYEFIRVRFPSMEEIGPLDAVTGGTIDEDADSDITASGRLDYTGEVPATGEELVRIYLTATEADDTARIPLGTYFRAATGTKRDEAKQSGQLTLYGMTQALSDRAIEATYTVEREADPVALAVALIEEAGLTAVVTPTEARTNERTVHPVGTTYLDVIRELLEFATYEFPIICDGHGRLLIRPSRDHATAPAVHTFGDTDGMLGFLPDIEDGDDWFGIPNVVISTYSGTTGAPLAAVAVNDDPASPVSVVNRRRVVMRDEVSDIVGVSTAVRTENLQARAAQVLQEQTATLQTVTLTHAFVPYTLGDVVALRYDTVGLEYRMRVTARSTDLTPGTLVRATAKRYDRRVAEGGGAL